MGAVRAGVVRNAVGSLAIAAVVALIAFGLPLLDRSLPALRAVARGAPYAIGDGVSVVPPASATLDVSQTRPATARGTVLFRVGTIRYLLVAAPYRGTLGDATLRVRSKITARPGYQVTGRDRAVRTDGGLRGSAGGYASPGRLGRYAVFVAGGTAVEVTASGPETELRPALPALDASLRTVVIRSRR